MSLLNFIKKVIYIFRMAIVILNCQIIIWDTYPDWKITKMLTYENLFNSNCRLYFLNCQVIKTCQTINCHAKMAISFNDNYKSSKKIMSYLVLYIATREFYNWSHRNLNFWLNGFSIYLYLEQISKLITIYRLS